MRILVFGGTGSVGRLVIEEALSRRHQITALVRSPQKVGELASRITVVQGDALDARAVDKAIAGQDVVIYTLGAGNVRDTTLFSESTRVLLTAMNQHAVRRLICVTGVGAGETKGHGGFLYDWILYPLFTKGIYADKDKQESVIRDSYAEWTIVRPASFRRHKPAGPLRAVTDIGDVTLRGISRQEVAQFLVDELEENRYVRQSVFIGHE